MDKLRESPLFWGWLVICALAATGGFCWLQELRGAARRQAAAVARVMAEREQLLRANPTSGANSQESIVTALREAQQRLAALHSELPDFREADREVTSPTRRVDAFFSIAVMVEKLRKAADRQGVRIRADEHFGFTAFVNHGPENGLLPAVGRQRRAVECLIGILFAAGPHELLAMQRASPVAATGLKSRGSLATVVPLHGETVGDSFVPDPRLLQVIPGLVGGDLVRLEFTGRTQVLRKFLGGVAVCPLSLVVRSVEVEPLDNGRAASVSASPPLIARNLSRFTVVVGDLAPGGSENKSHL